ncbi:MAG: phenylacetate--CoA ligase, partial [Steroidobacteraceae bacterium]
NVFPSQLEALIAHTGGLSPHYKLEISRQGPLDDLTLHVETLEHDHEGDAARRGLAAELTRQIKTYVGVSIAVVVHRPGTLERAPGKATRLIERRAAAR